MYKNKTITPPKPLAQTTINNKFNVLADLDTEDKAMNKKSYTPVVPIIKINIKNLGKKPSKTNKCTTPTPQANSPEVSGGNYSLPRAGKDMRIGNNIHMSNPGVSRCEHTSPRQDRDTRSDNNTPSNTRSMDTKGQNTKKNYM